MAGFFQRLAGRTLGVGAPVAQPLVHSVFAGGPHLAPSTETMVRERTSTEVFRDPGTADPPQLAVGREAPVAATSEPLLAARRADRDQDAQTMAPGRDTLWHATLPVLEKAAPPAPVPGPGGPAAMPRTVRADTPQGPADASPPAVPAARRGNAEASSAAPVIRVMIGRVDVRAEFHPPARPTRPNRQEPAPALSLEQYQKQRDGGLR